MNSKSSLVVASIVFGIGVVGCSSGGAKTEAAEKKAFLGGPMPKGFMKDMGGAQGSAPIAAQDAAAKAAAKAAADHAGK